jgi:hypothetical protein
MFLSVKFIIILTCPLIVYGQPRLALAINMESITAIFDRVHTGEHDPFELYESHKMLIGYWRSRRSCGLMHYAPISIDTEPNPAET